MCNARFFVLLVNTDHHAWHLKAQHEVALSPTKTSFAHTAVVTDDELCHFFFGHGCRDRRTKSVRAMHSPFGGATRKIQRTLNSDMRTLLRYITLRTGPVVVWVETIPLCQGLVFARKTPNRVV